MDEGDAVLELDLWNVCELRGRARDIGRERGKEIVVQESVCEGDGRLRARERETIVGEGGSEGDGRPRVRGIATDMM